MPLLNADSRFFLTRFPIFFAVPYLLLHLLPLQLLTEPLARLQAYLLNGAGIPAAASSSLVLTPKLAVTIIPDCTGLVMVVLLAALLYSTDIEPARRRAALLYSIPLLLVYNAFRLHAVILAGVLNGPAALDAMHFTLWLVDALLVLALWALAAQIRLAPQTRNIQQAGKKRKAEKRSKRRAKRK